MHESSKHATLVKLIFDTVSSRYCMHQNYIVYADSFSLPDLRCPSKINNCIPDFCAISLIDNHIIIGEAKANMLDLESSHSKKQLIAYITYCLSLDKALLLIATPWELQATARSIVRSIIKKNNFPNAILTKIEFLDEMIAYV